eukprot:4573307-Amphidinium_carterae.1
MTLPQDLNILTDAASMTDVVQWSRSLNVVARRAVRLHVLSFRDAIALVCANELILWIVSLLSAQLLRHHESNEIAKPCGDKAPHSIVGLCARLDLLLCQHWELAFEVNIAYRAKRLAFAQTKQLVT